MSPASFGDDVALLLAILVALGIAVMGFSAIVMLGRQIRSIVKEGRAARARRWWL